MKWLFIVFLLIVNSYAKDKKNLTLQLSWLHQFQFAGYYMAKEKGLYNKAGLNVTIKEYSASINIVEDIINEKTDFAVGRSSIIIDKAHGKEIVALGAVYQHSPMMILTRKDSNITTVSDLKNKRIMITDDAKNTAAITAMLYSNKLTQNDIITQAHSFDINDLISKKTDAMASYLSNEPIIMQDKNIQYNIIHPKDHGFDFYSDILFTSSKFLNNNPQTTKEFYTATLKGWYYAFENIEETAKIISEKYNSQNKSILHLIKEGETLKKLAFDKNNKIGILDEKRIEEIYSIFRVLGLTNKKIDSKTFIYEYNHPKKYTYEVTSQQKNIIILSIVFIVLFIITIFYYVQRLNEQIQKVEKTKVKLKEQTDTLQDILDTQRNIILITDITTGRMVAANKIFFDRFKFKDLKAFLKKYDCICDLFVDKRGFISKIIKSQNWLNYIVQNDYKDNKVLIRYDQKESIFAVHVSKLANSSKLYIAEFTDITLIQEKELNKYQAYKIDALEELLTNISHQWRQPLNLISTLSSTIKIDIELDNLNKDKLFDYNDRILSTTEQLSSLLDDFRIDKYDKKLLSQKDFLTKLIAQVINPLNEQYHDITFIENINIDKNISVYQEIYSILNGIIKNSIDALNDKDIQPKYIFIEVEKIKDYIIFHIYDNAGGVKDKILDKICEPYFTTRFESQGKGLGMFIISNLIKKQLKGHILLNNKQFEYNGQSYKGLNVTIHIPFD